MTDNGTEFLDPNHFEYDYNDKQKKENLFYCDPYSSWQKGSIEKNHKYIRKIFSKGTNWNNFTEEHIKKIEDNINNIPRESLNIKTPYELTLKIYKDFIVKLGCNYIKPDSVT